MRRALRRALRGAGRTGAAPLVGAVLVREGRAVGAGTRLDAAGAGAVRRALRRAGAAARGSELFVSWGDEAPLASELARAGVVRVHCAAAPGEAGGALEAWSAAGLDVRRGLLEQEARAINAPYEKFRTRGLPWTVLKLAQSLDGRIATRTGDSRWITGPRARACGHRWRSRLDAIMVGANTVLADDPSLNVRLVRGRDPVPVVLDGRLRVGPGARLFGRPGAVVLTAEGHPAARRRALTERGVRVWEFPAAAGRLDLEEAFSRLGREGIRSLLVEGGGQVAAAALRARLVDRLLVFVAPRVLGEGIAAVGDLEIRAMQEAIGLKDAAVRRLGPDTLYTAEVEYPCLPE